MDKSHWPRVGAVAIACTLCACGGGGGGDSADTVRVSADRSAIALIALNQSPMSTEPVVFTISGGKGSYYVSATSDNDQFSYAFNAHSDVEADVLTTPIVDIPPGTRHTGHITYELCSDQSCQHVVWSRAIPYTMTRYAVDTRPVALTRTEGTGATSLTLAVAPSDTDHQLTFSSSNDAVVTVDHTAPDQVGLTLPAQGASLHAYNADIHIGFQTALGAAPNQADIPVSLTVGSGVVAPAIAPLDITSTSTAASLAGQAPVAFASGQDAAWSATVDRDWLVLDAASGTGAGNIVWHVDTAKLGALANWASDTATLTISAAGMTSVSTAVTISKKLPEVWTVSPAAVVAGRASTVRVSGRGLSQLAGAGAISVGGAAPVGGSIDGDGAATLQLPALAAGSASVSVANALDTSTGFAALGVTPVGAFGAATAANTGSKLAIAFDATRNAIFASNQQHATLVRFQLVGNQWQSSELPIAGIGNLALSPDRRTVYVGSGPSLVEVDPDTMQVGASHAAPADLTGYFAAFGDPIPMTNDLRLWFGLDQSSMQYFDMRTGTFGAGSADSSAALYWPSFFPSPDGSVMMVANCTCTTSPLPDLWYDTATDSMQAKAGEPYVTSDVRFDERGSVMLVDSQGLYRTDTFALVGQSTIDPGVFWGAAVLSPDGTRIYREVFDGSSVDHVEVLDATAVAGSPPKFVSLGAIALPDKAVTCPATTTFCDHQGRLAIDPTGAALFWVGDAGLVVVPIPTAMAGIAQGGRTHAADAGRLRSALAPAAAHQARVELRSRRAH